MGQKKITIRGRVITKRMGRVAVICLRNDKHDEYDTDIPLSMLPKGVEDGAEVEITITVRDTE
jgi:ribosomal protein L36